MPLTTCLKHILPTFLREKSNETDDIPPVTSKRNNIKKKQRKKRTASAPGHLYIIKEREFLKTNENILKIGKTQSIKHRMPAYPKDSRVYIILFCPWDIHTAERDLIAHFDSIYAKRCDIGREYYETPDDDHVPVIQEFMSIMMNHL